MTLPIVIMADIFDVLFLDDAQQFFSTVEDNVVVWKEELFFGSIKNNLLRICNGELYQWSPVFRIMIVSSYSRRSVEKTVQDSRHSILWQNFAFPGKILSFFRTIWPQHHFRIQPGQCDGVWS